jgi:hypothetical protein
LVVRHCLPWKSPGQRWKRGLDVLSLDGILIESGALLSILPIRIQLWSAEDNAGDADEQRNTRETPELGQPIA